MPGPFPGMDPYLEDPDHWPGFHTLLTCRITEMLNGLLPSGYTAILEERAYAVDPGRSLHPDTMLARLRTEEHAQSRERRGLDIPHPDPPVLIKAMPDKIREPYIEIRTGRGWEQVATIVVVIRAKYQSESEDSYLGYKQMQAEVLGSSVHLLEIDLLRKGAHTVAAPLAEMRKQKKWDYVFCLSRNAKRDLSECWPSSVRTRLPRIRVPLAHDDHDIILDMQMAVDKSYDAGPYRRLIDYRTEPNLPLEGDDKLWKDAYLKEKGYRK